MKIATDLSLSLLITLIVFSGSLSTRGASEDGSTDIASGKAQIIVVVPTTAHGSYCSRSQLPAWERGDEILPGAFIAEDEINRLSDSTLDSMMPNLEVVPIKVPQCDVNRRIDRFVGNLTSFSTNVIAVVGYFCDNMAHYFSQIVGHGRYRAVQISATSPLVPRTRGKLKASHFHRMLPSSSVLAEAAVMLIRALNWSQIGIINQGLYHDKHFTRIKEEFLSYARQYNITTVFHIERNVFYTPKEILKGLMKSTAKIVVVFLPPFEAMELVCEAHRKDLQWPDYVWIYIETSGADLVRESKSCTENDMMIAMDKIIFIHFNMSQVRRENESLVSGGKYNHFYDKYILKLKNSSKNNCLQSNPYANLMYDSIWAIAIAMNQSCTNFQLGDRKSLVDRIDEELSQLSFSGGAGFVNFSRPASAVHPLVELNQGLSVLIDSYDTRYRTLVVNHGILGEIPSDELDIVYQVYPTYLTVILLTFLILLFLFTTAMMSLYIHYRKNPEIKASSSLLSLCMFVGCYCLVISSLSHTVTSGYVSNNKILRYASCSGDTLLFNVGLDIIMATVCAKTIRIHRIFTSMSKLSRAWSDKSLFGVIILVVSVKLLLMIIWAAVDTNHLIDERTVSFNTVPPHYVVVQRCHSKHLGLWVGLAFSYTVMLFVPMIIAAVLTRRIDKDPFKDSKKICALVAVLFMLISFGSALWFMLRNSGANIASKAVYSVGFALAALACQIFLFLPKIVPSVRRHMDILKTTWVDSSVHYSAGYVQAHSDHNYHLL